MRALLRRHCSPQRRLARAASTRALLYYQSEQVPRSLTTTGRVGTNRDLAGSDYEFFGVDPAPTSVRVDDGRGRDFSLDENGFCLVGHSWDHIDYFDNGEILNRYYSEVERLVAEHTGASRVLAFDHNLRAQRRKRTGVQLRGEGANAVQEPLITYGVHNDYTVASAPRRIAQLARPLGANDTLRARVDAPPPLEPAQLGPLLQRRWMFINVWRSVSDAPVERFPLALADAASVSSVDLVTFEIRYADRIGENYFARHSPSHRWTYFPALTKDEAVLIKCWDSRGRDFAAQHTLDAGAPTVPATFSLHSGFDDPATREDAPDRESIEVRTVAFFDA